MACSTDLIRLLRSHRVASVSQLAFLLNTSPQMVRRWVRAAGKAVRVSGGMAHRGRPEQWVSLAERRVAAPLHEWLLTNVSVELTRLTRARPAFEFTVAEPQGGDLCPDLTFSLRHQGMALLFFVEVDCGTEPMARSGCGSDVASKFERYVELRATDKYHAIGSSLGVTARGFRVLVVATSERRCGQLSRLASQFPGEFIWTTTSALLEREGIGGSIWHCHGSMRSLLGSAYQQVEGLAESAIAGE